VLGAVEAHQCVCRNAVVMNGVHNNDVRKCVVPSILVRSAPLRLSHDVVLFEWSAHECGEQAHWQRGILQLGASR
jgi:hypothetical protein